MLLRMPEFAYISCKTLTEAFSLLAADPDEARVVAGGTDLLVKMKQRRYIPRQLINIKDIAGLDYIRYSEAEGLKIGALATIESLTQSAVVMKKFTVLGEAASVLGTPHIRNLATLGGNLCNASPAAECAPALLTLGAKAKIESLRGARVVSFDTFFTGPGKSILQRDEILTEIQIPNLPARTGGVHLKYGTRRTDVAIVGISILLTLDGQRCGDVNIAMSAVGPTPLQATKAADILKGEILNETSMELVNKAARMAAQEALPIDDLWGSADYRRGIVAALVKEGLNQLISGQKKIVPLNPFFLGN